MVKKCWSKNCGQKNCDQKNFWHPPPPQELYFYQKNDPRGLKFCRRPHQAKLTTTQHNFNPTIFGGVGVIYPPPWVNPTCFFYPKIIFLTQIFFTKIFFCNRKFFNQNFFLTNIFFWPKKIFCPQKNIDPKNF